MPAPGPGAGSPPAAAAAVLAGTFGTGTGPGKETRTKPGHLAVSATPPALKAALRTRDAPEPKAGPDPRFSRAPRTRRASVQAPPAPGPAVSAAAPAGRAARTPQGTRSKPRVPEGARLLLWASGAVSGRFLGSRVRARAAPARGGGSERRARAVRLGPAAWPAGAHRLRQRHGHPRGAPGPLAAGAHGLGLQRLPREAAGVAGQRRFFWNAGCGPLTQRKRNESAPAVLTNKRVHWRLRRNFPFLIYIGLMSPLQKPLKQNKIKQIFFLTSASNFKEVVDGSLKTLSKTKNSFKNKN